MGSKYAALGRSKALSNIQGDILNIAQTMRLGQQIEDYQYKSALRKEADESVIDITPSQTVGDMVGQRAMQDKQDIRAIQSTAETRKATAEIDKQEAFDNKVFEVKNTRFMERLSSMSPKAANRVYKWADLNGFLIKKDGRVLITGRHLRLGQKMLMEDMEFQQALHKDMLIDSEGRIAKMESLLAPGEADIQNKDKVKLAEKDIAKVRTALAKEKKNHHYLLNVVNAGDWKTSKEKPEAKPDEWENWGYGQKRNTRTGEIKNVKVKPVKDSGKPDFSLEKEYRQTRQTAERSALTEIFLNDPTIMEQIEEWGREVDAAKKAMIMAGIHRQMTDTQKQRFHELINEYMRRSPTAIYKEHQRIMTAPRNVRAVQGTLEEYWK